MLDGVTGDIPLGAKRHHQHQRRADGNAPPPHRADAPLCKTPEKPPQINARKGSAKVAPNFRSDFH